MKLFTLVAALLLASYSNAISAQYNDENIGSKIKCDVAKEALKKRIEQFQSDRDATVGGSGKRASGFSSSDGLNHQS